MRKREKFIKKENAEICTITEAILGPMPYSNLFVMGYYKVLLSLSVWCFERLYLDFITL